MGQLTQTTAQVQEFLDNVALNPMTNTGDLIVGGNNGNPLRLGKGTAGQVLSMNAAGTAVEWATPGGGGGSAPTIVELSVSGSIFEPPSGSYPQYSSATFSYSDPNMTTNALLQMLVNGDDVVLTFSQNGTTFYMMPCAYGGASDYVFVECFGVVTGDYAACYRCSFSVYSATGYGDSFSFLYTAYTYHS